MTDNLDHHGQEDRSARKGWAASDVAFALFGIIGCTVLLALVATGVIHQ